MLYLSTSSTDIENSEFKESILIFGIIYRKYFESKNYNLIEIEDIKNSCHEVHLNMLSRIARAPGAES